MKSFIVVFQVYAALAKGGLIEQHVLVIPITHYPNVVFCPQTVTNELHEYIQALRRCYASQVRHKPQLFFFNMWIILV